MLAESSSNDLDAPLSPIPASQVAPPGPLGTNTSQGMLLVLGGYSYGSLIATLLPDTAFIMSRFATVTVGTAEAEIRLRALHLSTERNRDVLTRSQLLRDKTPRTPKKAMVMGGEESEPGIRRPSKDSRRSMDSIRRSMDSSRRKLGMRHTSSSNTQTLSSEPALPPAEVRLPETCYLLISPLRPPISSFMTMFSKSQHLESRYHPLSADTRKHSMPHVNQMLVTNPTLAVYGDKDFFTPQKKLRKWVEDLAGEPASCFRFHEIASAGHFWQEEGVETQLRSTISEWLKYLAGR